MKKPLFLLGFMGCGKSTLGKKIATKANAPFMDLDDVIVEAIGCSITEFVTTKGEAAFRDIEHNMLVTKAADFKGVVALGGGVPCFQRNLDVLLTSGTTLYLKYPPKLLADRVSRKKWKRPLIAQLSDEELVPWIENKLKERSPYYEQAQFTWNFHANEADKLDFALKVLMQENG